MHGCENGREILNPGFSPCHMELFFSSSPNENKESLTALEARSCCSGCTALEIVGWMVKVESNTSFSESPGCVDQISDSMGNWQENTKVFFPNSLNTFCKEQEDQLRAAPSLAARPFTCNAVLCICS
ncbi:uncharacterized protein ACIBXB_001208 [Morphnus guianensis]